MEFSVVELRVSKVAGATSPSGPLPAKSDVGPHVGCLGAEPNSSPHGQTDGIDPEQTIGLKVSNFEHTIAISLCCLTSWAIAPDQDVRWLLALNGLSYWHARNADNRDLSTLSQPEGRAYDLSVEAVPVGFKVVRTEYGETFYCSVCDRHAITNYPVHCIRGASKGLLGCRPIFRQCRLLARRRNHHGRHQCWLSEVMPTRFARREFSACDTGCVKMQEPIAEVGRANYHGARRTGSQESCRWTNVWQVAPVDVSSLAAKEHQTAFLCAIALTASVGRGACSALLPFLPVERWVSSRVHRKPTLGIRPQGST